MIAPPYDVIDPALQQALYDKSPYNVIRLILNKEEPTDTETENRYTRAARFLRDWQREDVLAQDSARSCTSTTRISRSRAAALRGAAFWPASVWNRSAPAASIRTRRRWPGREADRLKLFHATGMNLSPIFGLYPDPGDEVMGHLDAHVRRTLPVQATDHLGVVSRLWPVTDQHLVSTVTGLLGPKPVFIADGHHRYETSLRYLEERRAAGEVRDDEAPANFTLMMLVSMSDPGLIILPTHRLVSGIPDLTADRLAAILGPHFQLERIGQGDQGARDTWEMIEADGSQDLLGFGTVADGVWQTARFNSPQIMAERAANHSPAWRGLAVSILHVAVLDHLLPQATGGKPECKYVHLLREVTDAVSAKRCKLAVLVPPATMGHVEQIAGNLEKMPPKSTYFYPKLLSGLVFNSLKVS